jgi:hypothetical protein
LSCVFLPLGDGKRIPETLENSLSFYLKENANAASNRVAVNKNPDSSDFKKAVPVYYLDDKKTELYKNFKFSNQSSKSIFMKYLNRDEIFKNHIGIGLLLF